MTPPRLALVALSLAASLLACDTWRETLREGTYGPSFEYISPEQLKSTMWQMARDTRDVEQILSSPMPVSPDDRARVSALLGALYEESGRLGSEGIRTNHPLLDQDRDRFRADIAEAKRGVDAEPPSYTLARGVSASCVHCHNRPMR
jgi:hypothetical protein